jgi:pilus assembly protein FimV
MDTIRKTLIAASLALISASAQAAGLGKLTVYSALGQPFRAEIELVSVSREEALTLSARLAPPEAYRQANIDYASPLLAIKFKVEKQRPDSEQLILRMSSTQAINEPFLDMLVELDWAGGRLVREYNMLLDPPGYTTAAPPAPAPVITPPVVSAPPEVTAPVVQPPVEARPLAPAPEAAPAPATPPAAETAPAAPPAEIKPAAPAAVVKPAKPEVRQPTSVGTYDVKRGDTLRKIAEQNKIDGVSVDQMLIALYRNNHDAFIANNINRLRSGVILNIPDRDEALGTGEADARRLVTAQAADFNAYRRSLAGAVEKAPAAKESTAVQSAQGKITPKVEDKAAPAPGQDQLTLSKADNAGKAGTAAAKRRRRTTKPRAPTRPKKPSPGSPIWKRSSRPKNS